MITKKLYFSIAAVCPIAHLSIGDRASKATWRIDYRPEATAKQKADAQKVIDAFDWQVEEALLEKVEKYKRLAAFKAAKAEADDALDSDSSAAIQAEIDALAP